MKTSVEIANFTRKKIDFRFVRKIVRETTKLSGASLNSFSLSVVFVSGAEIRKINRKCRKKDKSTDVLSFCLDLGYNKKGEAAEGELVLCPEVIAKNARAHKVKFDRELAFVLAHGVLHVLGWKHSARMYILQDEVAGNLQLE